MQQFIDIVADVLPKNKPDEVYEETSVAIETLLRQGIIRPDAHSQDVNKEIKALMGNAAFQASGLENRMSYVELTPAASRVMGRIFKEIDRQGSLGNLPEHP